MAIPVPPCIFNTAGSTLFDIKNVVFPGNRSFSAFRPKKTPYNTTFFLQLPKFFRLEGVTYRYKIGLNFRSQK